MLGKKLKLKLTLFGQIRIKVKNYGAKFKLENFLSGTSQISKIRHVVSLLQCIKQRYMFLTHPV